ncbi:MAG TPA: type III pantothenate kinase [Pyrinomonadaceae bacterium]|nr:type III pantothenate kinase [Chloracidobacterium sp.]MBP9935248.1 type III pantothenate kinase [Pyrinomonadaceae bacterium]MBK7803102.1 type III pantothenate kinase [Chloracidobacterium sp.]MBK9438251.1 type III pantothenate kinase [Chloracidobacterium sp.]MBK9767663.1 type III pantothenate kinase [Chloracidobacterium sp.]
MLLAVDIGNTFTKFGIFDDGRLTSKLSIPTIRTATSEALFTVLSPRLPRNISAAIICSVVPDADAAMIGFLGSEYSVTPISVKNDLDFGLTINYTPLEAAGSDRLVNAFSAVENYTEPCIICSFGTALTIDAVDGNRNLLGGIIAPGMKTMANALHLGTARLPEIDVKQTERVIQTTTEGAISSGIFYGYLALAEGLIGRIKTEVGDNAKVIATGGNADIIASQLDVIDVVDGDLLLDGLQLLYTRWVKTA